MDKKAGVAYFDLESPTNGVKSCLLIKIWFASSLGNLFFSFVYKLALPFNFYLFLVASKTMPEDKGLFVNHHLVGF